jgi:lipopolysaccharide transport system permease protein
MWRDAIGRYRGSFMGIALSFFNPIFMLTAYTFMFSIVLKIKWDPEIESSRVQFALIAFLGMIIFNLFSETINRSTNIILLNVNFVKKVLFPLEVLPLVVLGSAFIHFLIGFFILCIAFLIINHYLYWTSIFLPLIWAPFIFIVLGLSWILAACGVYFRDIGQIIGVITAGLTFLSPIFYPISIIPKKLQFWIALNPLTFVMEQSRRVFIWGEAIDWFAWGIYCLISLIVLWAGFCVFQKSRKGFSDVL